MEDAEIVVLEGMLEAGSLAYCGSFVSREDGAKRVLKAALRWLSENPIVPTDEQANELWKVALQLNPDLNETNHAAKNMIVAWQRRMFLAPEMKSTGSSKGE
jgi:hypothetical protein